MAVVSLPQRRMEAPSRHLWLVLASVLIICAGAGGYALALHEVEALYVGVAFAACMAVMIDFRLGALLLVALLPVSTTAIFPHALMKISGLNPINILIAGTLAAYLVRGRLERPGTLVPRPLALLYILPIVLAGLLGTLYVDDIYPPFQEMLVINYTSWPGYLRDSLVKPMLIVVAAVLVAAALAKAPRPEPFIVALGISACLLAFVMFSFVAASGIWLEALGSASARAFFLQIGTHANELGRAFVTAYALLLFAWWEAKHAPGKLALFAALGILSFGILLTFSRNAFLGFLVVNGLFVIWKFNMKKLGLALFGLAVAVALAPPSVQRRVTYGFDSGADAVSAGRIDGIWLPLLPETLKSLSGATASTQSCGRTRCKPAPCTSWATRTTPIWRPCSTWVSSASRSFLRTTGTSGRAFARSAAIRTFSPVTRGFFQGACAALVAFLVAGMTGGSLRPSPDNVLLWVAIGMMYGLAARRPAS